jgi:glycosyltransferase involved in cell wall biosynthesis
LLDNKKYDIDLSIVVPAYNEVQRLPKMMNETLPVTPQLGFKSLLVFARED